MFRPIMAIVRFLYRLRGVYISECGCVDVEISIHQSPVALLSSAISCVPLTLIPKINMSITSWGCPTPRRNTHVNFLELVLVVHS